MDNLIMTTVLFGVCLPRDIPILVLQELITQKSHTAQCQRKSLPKGGVTGCCRIPYQRYASFIWTLNPHIVSHDG
jgi:hypothetical protein